MSKYGAPNHICGNGSIDGEGREGGYQMTIDEQMIETANRLVNEFGTEHTVSLQEIYQIFSKLYNRDQGSVIPSDYCYNRINNGIQINKPTVFEYLGRGRYRCLGLNYKYNGPIYHKLKSQIEFIVGQCVNGVRIIAPDSDFGLG